MNIYVLVGICIQKEKAYNDREKSKSERLVFAVVSEPPDAYPISEGILPSQDGISN